MQQQLLDLQHRLYLAEQSIIALEKSNYNMRKDIDFLKQLIKILNQKIEQPNNGSSALPNNEPPPHY